MINDELVVMSLDLGPNHTGFMIFWGEERIAEFGTLLPQLSLSMPKRIQYTTGILNVLCRVYGVHEVAIEDYAHKLRSASVTCIREQGGAIKNMLIESGIKVFIYNVSVIKKFATGLGRATKKDMARSFDIIGKEGKRITFRREARRKQSLFTEDEIDAWFIGQLHYDNVRRSLLGNELWSFEQIA